MRYLLIFLFLNCSHGKTATVTITSFGANGNGVFDNYNAFLAAAAYAEANPNTTITFPAGTFYIAEYRSIQNDPINHIYWMYCVGLKLLGVAGTKISMNGNFFRPFDYAVGGAAGGFKSYTSGLCPFWFYYCVDVEVANMEITGNVQQTTRAPGVDDSNPSVTESNSNMLRFEKCDNVNVHDMYLHHAESDGILIGGHRDDCGNWTNSSNFTFTNVRSYNNGRQGMSAGGLSNGYFLNCEFSFTGYTGGTYGYNDPGAGVDIEPGTTDGHNCDNITFVGCKFEGNYGNQYITSYPATTTDITLLRCTINTSDETRPQGITILARNVLIDSCVFNLGTRQMKFTNSARPGSTVTVQNSTITGSDNIYNDASTSTLDTLRFINNDFTYTINTLNKTFLDFDILNLYFLNNDVFIPAAAVIDRGTSYSAVISNGQISQGNFFHSENNPANKPRVNYTGTIIVNDLP